jgi:hypothetical protein
MVDCEVILLLGSEYWVDVPTKVGCLCEAASVKHPGRLLEGGSKRRVGLERSSWFGDEYEECIVNLNVERMAVDFL